jgi:predicted acylesterase/phospholipase RssA
LERVLQDKLGDTPLGAACRDVLVTAYDMAASEPVMFRSADYRGQPNPLMTLVARATAAGPTYFPPVRMNINGREAVLVDGGLAANNPALLGYAEAQAAGSDAFVISLGTGQRQRAPASDVTFDAIRSRNWLSVGAGVLSAAMSASGQVQDTMLAQLLDRPGEAPRYWRLEPDLGDCNFAMDDASEANVACLLAAAERFVSDAGVGAEIHAIAEALARD